nr:hypothetical protein [Angustibacter aerolatus]
MLPPGDLRMALSALCADDEWGSTWRDVLQHRFASQGEPAQPRRRQPAHRGPVGACWATASRASTGWAGCSAPAGGCCR